MKFPPRTNLSFYVSLKPPLIDTDCPLRWRQTVLRTSFLLRQTLQNTRNVTNLISYSSDYIRTWSSFWSVWCFKKSKLSADRKVMLWPKFIPCSSDASFFLCEYRDISQNLLRMYTLFNVLPDNARGYFTSCVVWVNCPRLLSPKTSKKGYFLVVSIPFKVTGHSTVFWAMLFKPSTTYNQNVILRLNEAAALTRFTWKKMRWR